MAIITLVIVVLTTGFSLYCFNNPEKKYKYLFWPYAIRARKEHYRFLSHAFVHGDLFHLLFNMYALWVFGSVLEQQLLPWLFDDNVIKARIFYIFLYTGAIYAASITEYFRYRHVESYTSLGASGAVNAIIFSFILCFPTGRLGFFFIPMPAWAFGILFIVLSYYMARRQRQGASMGNVGHEAHFWGAIFGFVLTGLVDPECPRLFLNFVHSLFFWL